LKERNIKHHFNEKMQTEGHNRKSHDCNKDKNRGRSRYLIFQNLHPVWQVTKALTMQLLHPVHNTAATARLAFMQFATQVGYNGPAAKHFRLDQHITVKLRID